ncbi:MIF4G domain-containing protein 2 [Elsinoe fawcettii]|nr:MIF4G domain-containing protein 2 [Elsinoe fawcettii]
MSRTEGTGPKLPKALLQQIGGSTTASKSRGSSRKALRKQERQNKKKANKKHQTTKARQRKQVAPKSHLKAIRPTNSAPRPNLDDKDDISDEDENIAGSDDDSGLGSIDDVWEDELSDGARSIDSPLPAVSKPPKMSKTSRARLEQEDAEIAALERKLGIKKKKGKAVLEDGLDDLLGEIDEAASGEMSGGKRKLDADEDWLKQKRRKLEAEPGRQEDEFEGFSDDGEEEELLESGSDSQVDDAFDSMSQDDDDDGSVNDVPSDRSSSKVTLPARENPYRAPVSGSIAPAGKYLPPSLRAATATQDESVVRLHRKIQGLVNRLSESNMLSILSSVEALYQDNPRGHVTEGLINTLLALVADSDSLSDTFITLHGGFIAGLYRIIGVDFGAQLLERIVQALDESSTTADLESSNKKQVNLVSLLATLYTFSVISSTIIYDLMRHYINIFSESSTELLLRIIRTCGPQLRSDDPSALKDVVALVSLKTSSINKADMSVRQSFMIETITDLKNNKLKSGLGASATRAEMITRMKKLLGTVKGRAGNRGGEALRVTLADIRDADKKGKWWLVGASWRDPAKVGAEDDTTASTEDLPGNSGSIPRENTKHEGTTDLLVLARNLGMNTDVRRSVFAAIMSAIDYRDAVTRVNKLGLKNRQLAEIPRVVVRCVSAEEEYNPYYAYVAKELCSSKREIRMGFQFALWDLFKRTGEDVDDEEEEEGEGALETREVVGLAKLFAVLLKAEMIPITVLKKLDFAYLKPKTGLFLEVMLTVLILDKGKGGDPTNILSKAAEVEDLRLAFAMWVKEVLMESDVPEKKRHKDKIRSVCEGVVINLQQQHVPTSTGPADSDSD